ncbi:hypothetical protein [Pedobacter sp. GR22-10]|uniref:hypothetical protein n=1 Tax=Pedobacter sp. GR22-10 TaxID=2994472 RepID=UPI00224727E2|nr:hypothetical protein [Pedobacter sp. GR22-10]MCX2430389.1 hypothetical protein [Pedobacter sp. GR22-10]
MKKLSVLVIFVILFCTSCNKSMVLDISVNNFKDGYEKTNPGSLDATTMLIRNEKTTVYPPFNKMPPDATYYMVPSSIKFYKKVENLHLIGLFVKQLPLELKELPNLENISFSIGNASSIPEIIEVLRSCKRLKAIFLMAAIVSDAQLNNLKKSLPKIDVSIHP